MHRDGRINRVAHIELAVLTRIVTLLGDVRYGVHFRWSRFVAFILIGRHLGICRRARCHLHCVANGQRLEEHLLVNLLAKSELNNISSILEKLEI